jgi:glycine/D-amino acid oxidase-like deaminating enzyme
VSTDTLLAETDVLVVGAGIYGCSIAYFLSRFGVSVAVVDAGDIGTGASAANAGNLHLQISPFSHADKDREWVAEFARTLPFFVAALSHWRRLKDELPCDLEWRSPGGIMVAETDNQMRVLHEKVALERAHGLSVEMLGVDDLRRLAPYIAEHVMGASYCPDEGMANALLAVIGLADGARASGACFILNAEVRRVEQLAGGWRISTPRGHIRCLRLVIAAGSSAGEIAAMAGIQLPMTHRVIQMVATEACEPFIDHLLYHAESRLTLKQVVNGNVLIGGGWTASLDPVFGRPTVLAQSLRGSLAVARAVVPRLAEVSVIRSWAGHNVYTPDGRPILGAVPGCPGLFAAVCNTYGFTLGPLCGLLVAELIAEQPPSFDLSSFSPARFSSAGISLHAK